MCTTVPTAIPVTRRVNPVVSTARWQRWTVLLGLLACIPHARAVDLGLRADFRIKYVASGVVYLEGGRNVGLKEDLKLSVKRGRRSTSTSEPSTDKQSQVIGQVRVISVAEISAVCEIVNSTEDIAAGDLAYLEPEDAETLTQQSALAGVRKYPQVITFSEGDPLEEEAREFVPRPPLPEINRATGRIGVEYGGISSGGMNASSSQQLGLILRADVTRINGTYWNLSGYWRGRYTSRSNPESQQTLSDLINRTYHLGMNYTNPNSRWVAGFGRQYLPWASSLETMDGGYFGRRFGRNMTTGVFAGSTPDPSSWNYNPNREMAGVFVNFEGGSFEGTRYTSTFGGGVSGLSWQTDRHFIFMENGIFYKRYVSVYQALQADDPKQVLPGGQKLTSTGISRSFVTLRFQPDPRVSIDINHNYFRDIPTFDPLLVGTGLLDKILFQGLSIGFRVDLPRHVSVYNSFGLNNRSGDTKRSLNQMYGVTMGQIWRTGIRADVRYSHFDSSFGRGNYGLLVLSRNFGEKLRWEVTAGKQSFLSPMTRDTSYRTYGTTVDWFPGNNIFIDLGFTHQNGNVQDYTQYYMGIGYRFDSRKSRRGQ